MRALLVPAATAALFATASIAFAAAQSSTGTVKDFDMKAHSLTLQDGVAYMLPSNFKDPGIKAGEKVKITWEMKGGKHEASQVTIVK